VLDEMDAQRYACCCQNTDFCCPGADDWSGDCGEEAERVSNEYMTAGTEPPEMPDDGEIDGEEEMPPTHTANGWCVSFGLGDLYSDDWDRVLYPEGSCMTF